MNNKPKSILIRLALMVAAVLAASAISSHAQSASGTISDVAAGGGVFDYTITLTNTGSVDLNSFWYGWTTSGNNLPTGHNPTSAGNSLGWANDLDGNSIQWENSSGTMLLPGQSGIFTFASTATPSAITTAPSGESVVYVSGTGPQTFQENDPGVASPAFSPTLVVVPEPASFSLLIVGSLGFLATGWRKLRA
jgi:hypothetical protein